MFSCLQILEAFLWFVLITLLNVTLIILTLSVSRLLNLLLRLVAFLLFLNPQCLASISRWITASSSWKRFCLFVCRALRSEERRVGKERRLSGLAENSENRRLGVGDDERDRRGETRAKIPSSSAPKCLLLCVQAEDGIRDRSRHSC